MLKSFYIITKIGKVYVQAEYGHRNPIFMSLYGSTPVFKPVGTAPPRSTFVFDDPKSILRGKQVHVAPQIKDNSLRNTYSYV